MICVWTVLKREQAPTERCEGVSAERHEQPPRDLVSTRRLVSFRGPARSAYDGQELGNNVWLEEGDGKDGEEDKEVDGDESGGVEGDAVCSGHCSLKFKTGAGGRVDSDTPTRMFVAIYGKCPSLRKEVGRSRFLETADRHPRNNVTCDSCSTNSIE